MEHITAVGRKMSEPASCKAFYAMNHCWRLRAFAPYQAGCSPFTSEAPGESLAQLVDICMMLQDSLDPEAEGLCSAASAASPAQRTFEQQLLHTESLDAGL